MNTVQLAVAPNVAQAAAKATGRATAQGSDAAPAEGADGGFAALMLALAAPVGEATDPALSTPAPQAADALAPGTPPAPAEADPALLAMAVAMASHALPQEAPHAAGLSLRGEAAAPDAQAEIALAALDARTPVQGAAGFAGRAVRLAVAGRSSLAKAKGSALSGCSVPSGPMMRYL